MVPQHDAWAVKWPAPAKLNLFLHIVGQRRDGYHRLQTAFQFIDLADTLEFSPRKDTRIARSAGLAEVSEDDDLTVRAARLLSAATGIRKGVDIRITKRIPAGGGLGGGSSDAATTLLALNHLWQLNLAPDSLATMGLQLGADVPVFVLGQAAWAEGVGEQLSPMAFDEACFLVIDPGCPVSTAEIFADPELTRNSAPVTIPGFLSAGGRNDCETVVRKRYSEVAQALDWLGSFGESRLTGTGGCVFLACLDENQAHEICAQVPGKWTGFVARGLNESPVRSLIRRLTAA